MIPDDKLIARAREHYDDATSTARHDAATKPLTSAEREAMGVWISHHEDPIRIDGTGDVYVSGMFLGARRRADRRAKYEAEVAEQIAALKAARTELADRHRADEASRYHEAWDRAIERIGNPRLPVLEWERFHADRINTDLVRRLKNHRGRSPRGDAE